MTQIYQNKIVNVWLVLLWDNKYNFYFICRSWENQLQYLIFFFKRNYLNSTYMDAVVNFFDFIFRLSLALLALSTDWSQRSATVPHRPSASHDVATGHHHAAKPQPPQTHIAATTVGASGSLICPTHHCLWQ